MYDIIIIGSGPAGLSAAVYASRARISAVVIEKDYAGMGQIAVSERVDNYLGFPGISGYDLGEKFLEHAKNLGAEFYEGEAENIAREGTFYTVTFNDRKTLKSKAIIYAAGTSYRKLEVAGAELLGVSYCAVCDGMFYKNKTVAVIGGGDTALGDALYLSKIAKKIYLIHRREEFRANMTLQEAVKNTPNIDLVLNAEATEIIGEKRVEGIKLLQSDMKNNFKLDGVFVAIGSVPNSAMLKGICDLDKNGYVVSNEDGITSASGIFAAGDVRTKQLRQVVTAVSDGACCVKSVQEYLMNLSRI